MVELLRAGRAEVELDLDEVFWSLSVAVGVDVVLPSVDVVGVEVADVCLVLPCARAAAEKRDRAANVVRRSDRLNESRCDPIASVLPDSFL